MVRTRSVWLVGSLFVLGALAGCVGTSGSESVPSGSAAATADAGAGADNTEVGSIEGQVTDDELRPVEGARIGIVKIDVFAVTDASGHYSVINLAPGTYDVFADKLGYASKGGKVAVEVGNTTSLDFVLVPLAVAEIHFVVDTYSTLLECMVQSTVWVSTCSWPYELVYLTAHKNGVNLSNYGAPSDIQQNKFRHNVILTPGAEGVVGELEWKATTDLAKRLRIVDCREYDQIQDTCAGKHHPDFKGESPIRGEWKLPKELKPKEGKTTTYVSAVWLDWGGATDVGVVLQQRIDLYNSIFFQGLPPEEWSILAPKG
ncbi:MAG TPA: carboxypeptidase-like regulatory domain-containing protein [Candidatus Thermoplasmatota archaeon]|nr:carboxypeptidase-like regulatory domain-containing protein [Candidatus Thermoplasmatota archaeon]